MIASLPVAAQTQQPIRVHCGGSVYTDSKGQVWQADYGYSGGATYSFATHIKGTPDPALFASERYNSGTSPLVYSFSVANGSYHVNLLFAENYSSLETVGARVFNVKIQGNPGFQNLDIFAAAGARTALLKGADVTVSNVILNIEFDNLVSNAKVDGIEILPASSGPLLTLNFKYPDGTPVVGTLAYTISSSPLNFQGSVPLANGQAECLLFANPARWESVRNTR